jgi:hypothetical protein
MKMPWNKHDLGRELRAARPKPPAALESSLEHEIDAERRRFRGRVPAFRLGFAAAATTLLLATFTVAGGMAAASSSVRSAFTSVAQAVHITSQKPHARTAAPTSPARDQYGRKKNCVKAAADRRNAARRAADTKLNDRLALAGKSYKQQVTNARKLAAKQKAAAIKAAYGKYLAARAAAYKLHAAAIAKATKRYKTDFKKCPIV